MQPTNGGFSKLSIQKLIELMRKHDVVDFELDGYEVKLTHTETDNVKVKKTAADE